MVKIIEKLTKDLTENELKFCHDLFIRYYTAQYATQDPKNFEFPIKDLNDWLLLQLRERVGDSFLISEKGFLTFSVPETDYLHIFQFVIDEEASNKTISSMKFLRELGKKYPKRSFRSAIRKSQIDQTRTYVKMGCTVTEDVNLPGYHSSHYVGVEMPHQLVRTLSIF